MKTFRKRKIWISSLLALSLLINVLSASAEGADNHSESTTTETEQNHVESPIVNEDVSKRGENEKHFLCEDGSYIAVAYADAVHEKNEQDEWTEIDNTLAFENNRIENHSESFHTSFSETANPAAEVSANTGERLNNSTANASDGQLVSIESGENRLSWSLSATSMLNAQQTAQLQQQGCVLESAQGDLDVLSRSEQFIGALPAKQLYRHSLSTLSEAEVAQKSLPENPTNDDIINNLKTSSSVIYQNALGNDVDLQYTVNPGRIKEDIIINERGTFVSYTMNLDTGGLIAVLNDDNSVSFLDDQEKVCFTISVPYMYDSADTESYDIDVEMLQNGNNCTVTFIPDANWLNDSTRVYPVTIDLNLYTGQTTDFYSDTYVIKNDTKSYGSEVKMYCGYRSGKVNRAYLRITKMPVGLPLASQITGATLIVPCLTGTTSSKPFSLYQVNGSWDESSLKWSNQPAETLLESGINRGSDNIVRFSSTNLKDYVCKYYANVNNNYGFSIRYTNETANDYNSFYTKENGNSGGRPKLKITYYPPVNIADGTYYIRNKKSGHYLDAANSGGAGANVSQYKFHGATNQQWVFKKQTANNTFKGYYRISPGYNTGLYLDVANGNASNETNIQVYTRTEANAQHWTIIDNGNGTYRLMSKASSNRKCVTVQNASTASGANVFQYQYNGSGNDEWYLTPADNRIIGEFRLFVSDHSSTSSSSLVTGHAFISVKNTSDLTIPMGALNIPSNTEMSFGTWDLPNHSGIIYNLETCKNHEEEQSHYINVKTILRGSDLADLNNHMATHDFWEWNNNCSYFAISMWGLVSSAPVKFNYWLEDIAIETPYMLKRAVLVCGQPIEYGRILTRVTPIGFVENGAFVDRSANNPQD